MRIRRIRLLETALLPVIMLSAVLLGGCGKEEEREPVELTFIHGWGGTVKTHATMQVIYEEFEKENPDIVLRYQPSSDSSIAVGKANDMLAVGKMPDIVSTNGESYYIQNAVKRGLALDLTPYLEKDESFKQLVHPSVLEGWTTAEGSIYTVPDALEVMGYWYNEAAFRRAGIVDENGEAKPPSTWKEFFQACDSLSAAAGREGEELQAVYALEKVQTVENLFLARLAGCGEEGLKMAQGIPENFDTGAFRTAAGDFRHIFSYSGQVAGLDDARQYFKDGKTAMYFNGVWESEELASCSHAQEIAYANYPTDSGKSLSYVSPSSGYILADTGDEGEQEAAVRFLKYILSEKVQLKLALQTGQAPSNPQVDTAEIIKEYPMLGNALLSAHEADIQIKTASSVWNSRLMDILDRELKNACGSEEGIRNLAKTLNRNRF